MNLRISYPGLEDLLRTPGFSTPVVYHWLWRREHMRRARKARADGNEFAMFECVDMAKAQSLAVRNAKVQARDEAMRFGQYGQRSVGPGVWTLAPIDELRAAGAL